jgi:Ca2+-binding RTX toxin-like protein
MATIDDLRAAAAAGNPALYYALLAEAGDRYGLLALDVVNPVGYEGAVARNYANSVGEEIGVTLSGQQWFDLSVQLMERDLAARERKLTATGSFLNLSGETIRNYHVAVFDIFGLPPEAWTAEIPLRLSGYSEATWQLMLADGEGVLGSYLNRAAIFRLVAAPFAMFGTIPYIQDQAVAQEYTGNMALASFWLKHFFGSGAWINVTPDIQPFIKQTPDGVVIGGSSNANAIDGGSGHDLIFGYDGQDTLNGGGGDDVLYGGAGDDTLHTSRGNDVLHGGAGYRAGANDWLADGTDTADYSTSESGITIDFSDGEEVARERGEILVQDDGFGGVDKLLSIEKIIGSSHDDHIVIDAHLMTNAPLTIDGGDGIDEIAVTGEATPVLIDLIGGRFSGENGSIRIENFEQAQGGSGNDLLIGKDGHVLKGGAGADYLLADGGAVTLDGGAGNDYLEATGDGPVTYVFGRGSGHDVIGSLWPSPGYYNGSIYERTEGYYWYHERKDDRIVFQDLTLSDVSFVWDYDVLWGEYYEGDGWFEDYRQGGMAVVINETGDSLYIGTIALYYLRDIWTPGSEYHENIYSRLYYSRGANSVNHRYNHEVDEPEILSRFFVFSDGTEMSLEEIYGFFFDADQIPSVDLLPEYTSALDEHMAGAAGQGVLPGDGSSGPDAVAGTGGSDRLYGGDGADTLTGGGGNDIVLAGNGNDLIVAGSGDDYENGGSGVDTLSFVGIAAGVTVNLAAGTAFSAATGSDALSSIENVIGGAGNDLITGNDDANALTGGGGNDTLDGGSGVDTLTGGLGEDTYVIDSTLDEIVEDANAGTDTVIALIDHTLGANLENLELRGGAASGTGNGIANVIVGSGGANVLKGLDGSDTLTGGAGADRFEFFRGETGRDTITDFTHAEDKIVLTDFGLDMLQAGVNFMVDAGPVVARATLLYDNLTGILAYGSDGTGAAAATQIAQLAKRPVLTARDFMILETV